MQDKDIIGYVTLKRKDGQIIAISNFNIKDTGEAMAAMKALSNVQKQLIDGSFLSVASKLYKPKAVNQN